MEYYCGIDVSLEQSSVCLVNASGVIVREATVSSEPEALIAWLQYHRGARHPQARKRVLKVLHPPWQSGLCKLPADTCVTMIGDCL